MFILYDLIFIISALIYLPIYLFRRKFHQGFLARLGFLPLDLKLNNPIWIHAVSVGEAMAIKELVKELKRVYPTKKFVISTVTPTGNKIAQRLVQEGDFVTYLPLDFGLIIRHTLNKIKPSLFIIAETEIWPNLITQLYRRKIPVILVNARISDRAFFGYRKIKLLLKSVLEKISLFCAQTDRDAQRFQALGAPGEKVKVTGNMKFDVTDYTDSKKDYTDYRRKLALESKDRLLVAGSTHPGEEEMILGVYKDLLNDFPNLKLLLAPRHPERAQEVANLIKQFNFEPLRISLLDSANWEFTNSRTVFILDTVGQLINYYAIAEIVFVGGSLIKKGGHNILEPASQGKPILFGPYMFNFRDIIDLFLIHQAAISVYNIEELKRKIKELLDSPTQAQKLGQLAKDLILSNTGATKRNLELIRELTP
jgi:3-deoxy-D-manno-octulosonic-acid transferase